jgi:hypothetical protein
LTPRHRLTFAAVSSLILIATLLPASEPDGRTILRYAWAPGAPNGAGVRLLKLTVTAASPLHGVRIRIEPPAGIRAEVAGTGTSLPGRGRSEKLLGDFAKGVSQGIEFSILIPYQGGGIVSVRVEGTGDDGRPFVEGLGVPVGTPGKAPAIRNGAAEFPAGAPSDHRR